LTERRWVKWLPVLILLLGVVGILAGFVYDVIFAGIPYQDPTPELAARYALHAGIARTISQVGLAFVLLGGAVFLGKFIRSLLMRGKKDD